MSHNDSESSPPLLVSTLDIYLKAQTGNEVESIIVNAGTIKKEIPQVISPGGSHQERFNPPLDIPLHTKISVFIHYRGAFHGNAVSISLDPKTVSSEANNEDGKQVYCKTEGDVEVAIGIQSLPSTSNEVLASFSSFRVLILGESGVGKSSLISKVFGDSSADVCDTERGQANVEHEYVARLNDGFVVHDSCGFESADHRNLEAACNFISGRRRMQDLKDQLHAVWLCLEIPFAGARLIEAGVEKFLKDKENVLGNIPLIVVFTKLDLLENMLRAEALVERRVLAEDVLQRLKQELLKKSCLVPVQMVTGKESHPYVIVSTSDGYEGSLTALVKNTRRIIQKYIEDEAAHHIPTVASRTNDSRRGKHASRSTG